MRCTTHRSRAAAQSAVRMQAMRREGRSHRYLEVPTDTQRLGYPKPSLAGLYHGSRDVSTAHMLSAGSHGFFSETAGKGATATASASVAMTSNLRAGRKADVTAPLRTKGAAGGAPEACRAAQADDAGSSNDTGAQAPHGRGAAIQGGVHHRQ